eukprot:6592213-Prymnesium_polylepis.1
MSEPSPEGLRCALRDRATGEARVRRAPLIKGARASRCATGSAARAVRPEGARGQRAPLVVRFGPRVQEEGCDRGALSQTSLRQEGRISAFEMC